MFVELAGLLLALWYGTRLTHGEVSLLRSVVKTAATGILVIAGVMAGAPVMILAGLTLGAAGDFFLSRRHETGFLPGLVAFLLGHSCYVIWAMSIANVGSGLAWMQVGGLVALLVLAGAVVALIRPKLGALTVPVLIYVAVSLVLGALAIVIGGQVGGVLFLMGALAFIGSDMILAVQLFVMDERHPLYRVAATVLWGFYWAGQAGILKGALALSS